MKLMYNLYIVQYLCGVIKNNLNFMAEIFYYGSSQLFTK